MMIVVTDGESHDGEELQDALRECENRNITRYAIAVSTSHKMSFCFSGLYLGLFMSHDAHFDSVAFFVYLNKHGTIVLTQKQLTYVITRVCRASLTFLTHIV